MHTCTCAKKKTCPEFTPAAPHRLQSLVWSAAEFGETLFVNLETKLLLSMVRSVAITIVPVAWFRLCPGLQPTAHAPKSTGAECRLRFADDHGSVDHHQPLPRPDLGQPIAHSIEQLCGHDRELRQLVSDPRWLQLSTHTGSNDDPDVLTRPIERVSYPDHLGDCRASARWLGKRFLSISSLNPYPWFDLSTIGFAAASLILKEGVLRYGLLDHLRVLRDQVVENLTDGVVVLKSNGQIIDANPRALKILSLDRSDLAQRSIGELVTTMPLTELNERQKASVEITLNDRAFEISSSSIDHSNPHS